MSADDDVSLFRTPMLMLTCRDLSRTVDFYRDALGFEETYRFPSGRAPDFVVVELDGVPLGLASAGVPTIHGRTINLDAAHRVEMCIYTRDLDLAVERLRASGVPVLLEPCVQPWGERVAYVVDPDDMPVMLAESPSEPGGLPT